MCFPQKSLFIQQKQAPDQIPAPPREWGFQKSLSRPFRALSRARIRAGVGLWGLETLCLVEQIHSTNPGRARSAGRGCGPGTSDNGGGASPELVRNLLAGTVQSPIGAGLRRQELLRGRRDTPAKSSAAAETDNGCENSETVGLGEGFGD